SSGCNDCRDKQSRGQTEIIVRVPGCSVHAHCEVLQSCVATVTAAAEAERAETDQRPRPALRSRPHGPSLLRANRFELPRFNCVRDDLMPTLGQQLCVVNRWRLEARWVDWIVNHEQHVRRLCPEPALRHHLARPNHGERYNRKTRFYREQKAA